MTCKSWVIAALVLAAVLAAVFERGPVAAVLGLAVGAALIILGSIR